ncbi:hypothetical protein ACSBR2_010939 [Camellia fascicularis]
MADEIVINGGDDRREEIVGSEEDFVDFDESESKASGLMQRIEALEVEKRELVRENEEERGRVKNLKKEIEGLEGVVAELKRDNKGLESVAARASQLEIEVSRMQHDLISSMSEGEEANKEVSELKRNGLEMEKMKKEREEIEIVKNELEGLLKKSERKGKEMENKMAQLHKELEASEQMIIGLKEKTLNDLNGKAIIGDDEMGSNGLKQLWPVVAGSTGTIAAIAVIYYLRCAMRR